MKTPVKAAVALLATTAIAQAGSVERSPQSMAVLFEEGTYLEFGAVNVSPTVSGVSSATGQSSGDVSPSYISPFIRYRQDITDSLSFALIGEEHIGADIAYPFGTGYPIAGNQAELPAFSITGVVRYEFPSQFSVYGGLRISAASGDVDLAVPVYTLETDTDIAVGYLLGVAYEIPEIALRVNLTYNSAYTHELDATENGLGATNLASEFETEIPQSIHLEAQSGIAEDTLLFGSIRWVEWSEFDVTPAQFTLATGGQSLVNFQSNRITYRLGVGRRFNETWSGAVSLVYEPETDDFPGANLGPTDGRLGIGFAGTYTVPSGAEITGFIEYSEIGNTVTVPAVGTGSFEDNSVVAAGVRFAMNF